MSACYQGGVDGSNASDSLIGSLGTRAAQRGSTRGDPEYLALLDHYTGGRATDAVVALSAWPHARVRAAVQTVAGSLTRDRLLTAIMLHTEVAFGEPADGRESFQAGIARSFLRRLVDGPVESAATGVPIPTTRSTRDLGARWHALIGTLYCMRNDDTRAQLEISRGLTVDSNHQELNLVAAVLIEHAVNRAVRGQYATMGGVMAAELSRASERYRVILSTNPDFLEARLRLGWVLHLNNSPKESRQQLEQVAARATSGDVQYLAHLFLGAVHERAHRFDEAGREYEAARALGPLQSSTIGLIRVEAALGHDDRARTLAREFPSAAGPETADPWHLYNMCFTGGRLLEGLRAEARRR